MSTRLTRRERRELERQEKKNPLVNPVSNSQWYWLWPCLAGFVVCLPSLNFDFIRNDRTWISQIGSLWVEISQPTHIFTKYYRPVATAWMWLVNLFAGFTPQLWHLSSLLLHVLATYLVYRLALKLLEDPAAAMWVSLIFAVHPVHNDAILWILASNEILYVIGFLAAVLLFEEHPWWSVAAWTFALFSKETAIVLLPVLFLLAIQKPESWTKRFMAFVPFVAAAIVYVFVRGAVVPSGVIGQRLSGLPWRPTLYTSPFVIAEYLRKLAWPAGLSPMYGFQLHVAPTSLMWFVAAIIVFGSVALAFAARRSTAVLFSFALIALPLLPALYVIRFSPTIEMIQDRYLYLPSVGVCLLLGCIAKKALQWRRNAALTGLAAICTLFALLCYAQEGFYANQEAMYARVVEYAPHNQCFSLQLANSYAEEGRYEEALVQYKRACPIEADLDCVAGLAEGQYFTHRYAEALPRLQTTTKVLDHTDSGRNPTMLIQHEQFLLWLADTQRHLGNSVAAEETDKRAQATAASISAQPEANALARAFKVSLHPPQVNR